MKVLILCGVPGSGKTTFAKEKYSNYYRISQDDLGSKEKCKEEFLKAIHGYKNVLVDRCNHNSDQRRYWINIALQSGVESIDAIYLVVPEEEAIARIIARKEHLTINEKLSLEKKKSIVYFFNKELTEDPPKLEEGFKTVTWIRNY